MSPDHTLVQAALSGADNVGMGKHRLVVGVATLLYVGLGAWVVYIIAFPITDQNSDLRSFDPVANGIIIGVYLAGAALLFRWARARRTWRVILVPIAFVPAVLLALIGTLLAIDAVG
ncbi:MAG: hypothetical protein ACXVRK_10730 [Gaiellaceae bacterium]